MRENNHPPLQRHASLQPFSRDHFMGLKAANGLLQAADNAARIAATTYFHQCWDAEIAAHFREEEELLIPLMLDSEIRQMRYEHDRIRNLVAADRQRGVNTPPSSTWCATLGRELHDHIRWEERVLFGAIQDRATPAQLASVGAATAEIEKKRPGLRIRGRGLCKQVKNTEHKPGLL